MRVEYYNRSVACAAYRRYRKTWSRDASLTLTYRHHAADPKLRLSAAITLAVFKIPQDGVYP